jgi:hypothetical protein
MVTSRVKFGKPEIGMSLNGALAGLVAITAPCASVTLSPSNRLKPSDPSLWQMPAGSSFSNRQAYLSLQSIYLFPKLGGLGTCGIPAVTKYRISQIQ